MPDLNSSAATGDGGSAARPGLSPATSSTRMEEELDLGWYLYPLRRRWKLVAGGVLVGAVAGLAGASLRPVLYEGVTTILIGRSDSVVASATSRALIENHTLAAETLAEIGIQVSPQAFVSSALVVEQVPGTNVMKVRVTFPDAVAAAQTSKLLSQRAVELNRRIASDEGSAVRSQLKMLLDQSAERLKAAEEQYLDYQDQAQVELLRRDTDRMIRERGELLRLRIDIETEKARLAASEQEILKHDRVLSLPRAAAAEAALQRGADRTSTVEANDEIVRRAADQIAALADRTDKPLALSPSTNNVQGRNPDPNNGKDKDKDKEDENKGKLVRRDPMKDTSRELNERFAAQSAAIAVTQEAMREIAVPGTHEARFDALDLSHPFINPVYQTLAFQIATSRTRLAALERQHREMTVVRKLGGNRFGELSDLYRRTGELAKLENNLDLARRVYGDLTVKYEQSRSESVDSMVQLQIVDEAMPPERSLPRKRAQATALGMTVGFVAAGLAALAWGSREGRRVR